uniref:G-protein coupled receptors family 1 profile domain-containing protein n=1 Tax=Acrobeloides nanus TaxID=290746 RepID=A0A914E5E0_9BILA
MPKRGVWIDEFYLVYMKGFWAQLCSFIPITGGVIQYLTLSIIAVNRLVVIVWSTKIQRPFFDKCTRIALAVVVVVSFLVFSPYFYLSTTSYHDYRNGSAEVYTEAGCSASNTALVAVYNVMLMVAKSSTVLFGFAVYIAMFLLTLLLKKKKTVNKSILMKF